MNTQSILKVENVSYHYEKTTRNVIDRMSAEFEKGKLYVLTGRSGAGKSTFLSLLAGLDKVSSGKILYKGKNLCDMDADAYRAREIGVVFQGFNLLKNCSAVENILLSRHISEQSGAKLDREKEREEVLSDLSKIGIDPSTAERKVMHISGGEQQRISIARALSHDPDIVIADEPTGNLDAENAHAIMKIFEHLAHDKGKCVIVVTHSTDLRSYGDVVMEIGAKR
ncbi:MAG: ABC transporter ATP-binding protein [Clostridiales bacterium]|nr:ABC transporter ATP-binding protein [Clostridiales bacterium]